MLYFDIDCHLCLYNLFYVHIQEYIIKVQRGPLPERSWRVSRRYNDFVQLNAALSVSGFDLPLPPKRIIGNMEPDFIAQRQIALQVCLKVIQISSLSVYKDNNNKQTKITKIISFFSLSELSKHSTNESYTSIFTSRKKVF